MRPTTRYVIRLLTFLRLYPHIWFRYRTPLKIYEFREMLKGVELSPEDVVLDIGCGTGDQTLLLAKECAKAVGIDPSEQSIQNARFIASCVGRRVNCEFRCTRLEDAGFEGECFDKVFSICVLEHIPDYRAVLHETHRVLKPGGWLVFSVDALQTIADEQLIRKHMQAHHVYKYFTGKELESLLGETGFREIEVRPFLRSDFVRDLFAKWIREGFRSSLADVIRVFLRLRVHERAAAHRDKGIFLIAKCRK